MTWVFLFLLCFRAIANDGVWPLSYEADDLSPLDELIEGAEVVAIGESGHGVSGYLKTRLKVIRHLVEKKNFRSVILEEGYFTTEKFNHYLKDCTAGRNDPKVVYELVKNLNVIYANQEMLDTFTWLCDYNRTHAADPVAFHGMDIWETPWTDRDVIQKVVSVANDPGLTRTYDLAVENCWGWKANSWTEAATLPEWAYLLRTWRIEPVRHYECEGALMNLKTSIASKRTELEGLAGKENVLFAEMALKVQETYQNYRDLYKVDFQRVLALRDSTQAALTLTHMGRHKNRKSALLAHNIHASKKQSAVIVRHPDRMQWINVRSTGELLRGHLGRGYKAIALSGYKISSSRDGDYPVPTANDSLDLALSTRGDFLLVNPRANWITQQGEWWMHLEGDENGSFHVPHEQYDAIIFLKESGRATDLKAQELF